MEQRRKIEEEREARRCLSAVEAAGGTIKEWARANGVDSRSLNAWRKLPATAHRGEAAQVAIDGTAFAALLVGIDFTAARLAPASREHGPSPGD